MSDNMVNVKSTPKRSLEELLEGFDANDIATYLTKITIKTSNNSDTVNLSENTSELAGYQPYRSGDTQPSTSGKGQGNAKALIYATGNTAKARKKIRKTSKDWQGLTFEQYLKWDIPDEGQGASSR